MPPLVALGRILVVRHFACPTSWWASCLLSYKSTQIVGGFALCLPVWIFIWHISVFFPAVCGLSCLVKEKEARLKKLQETLFSELEKETVTANSEKESTLRFVKIWFSWSYLDIQVLYFTSCLTILDCRECTHDYSMSTHPTKPSVDGQTWRARVCFGSNWHFPVITRPEPGDSQHKLVSGWGLLNWIRLQVRCNCYVRINHNLGNVTAVADGAPINRLTAVVQNMLFVI